MVARVLLALTFALALALPATADVDIIPEALTLKRFKLDGWDPNTGLLHGTISGERAGTGGVTVQILAGTRIRRASLRNHPPNPIRTDLENWNTAWAAAPANPVKTFGDPATPGNPCSPIVTNMVTDGGYVRLKLNSDLATVRAVKPYYPGDPV